MTSTTPALPLIESLEALEAAFAAQKQAFSAQPYPEYAYRADQLKRLKRAIAANQDALAEAMDTDFGRRSHNESKLIDVLGSMLDINHSLRALKRWMKPSKRRPELLFTTNSVSVRYQPKGVVGIIVPWNFPVYLAVSPLVAALAAGNRVMVKMSESTPQTAKTFAAILAEVFSQDEVAVVGGELELAQQFSSLPFDHLLYTGSTNIGRQVMQAAAKNLTPVTLELGGKSPAVVSADSDLAEAAQRIAHGKSVNGGQICIAPDYALVPEVKQVEFLDHLRKEYHKMYAGGSGEDDTDVISQRHYQRLQDMLEDAREKGAEIHYMAEDQPRSPKHFPLTVVTGVTDDMRVMQEEIFGSILPVKTYRQLDEAIAHINQGERPLALYFFGRNAAEANYVLDSTHSGGASVNDWGWHAFNHDVPFGGVGASGMGKYHGHEGFLEFSHARSVFRRHRFFPVKLFNPPYGAIHKTVFRLFIGK